MRKLLDVAAAVLPGEDLHGAALVQGGSHHVVLLPGIADVRIARKPSAVETLPRRCPYLAAGTPACAQYGRRPGRAHRTPEPAARGGLFVAAARRAHAYAGGNRWAEVLQQEVIPRLPTEWRDEARRRVEAALALPDVRASLVHGDLAGENMHWADGRPIGVLDWDLAQPFDPAVDAACLAWHGWDTLAAAVDPTTMNRARTWYGTFGLEQIAFAVLNGASEEAVAKRCETITAWLERSAKILSGGR